MNATRSLPIGQKSLQPLAGHLPMYTGGLIHAYGMDCRGSLFAEQNDVVVQVLDHTLLLRVGELHLVVFQTYVLLFNPHAPATKRYVTALKDALR